jgi:hypothetical protein
VEDRLKANRARVLLRGKRGGLTDEELEKFVKSFPVETI